MSGFDPLIHAPPRLQICAVLASVDKADFATVREAVGVSDSVLSKHLRHLEEDGVLEISKVQDGPRTRTWAALTGDGRKRFEAHVRALRDMIGSAAVA